MDSKLKRLLFWGTSILLIASCESPKPKNENNEIIDCPFQTLAPTYKDRDGVEWSTDNMFAPGPNESLNDEKFQRGTSGNQYGKGYEQGQNDARRGLDPDPEGYGGNGQFEKGYEDGYEDW